jgi:hypothetical protein
VEGAVLPVFWKKYGALSDGCFATPHSAINPKTDSVTSLTVDSFEQNTNFVFTKNVQLDYDWSLCL